MTSPIENRRAAPHEPAGWGRLAAAVTLGTAVVVAAVDWSVHREVSVPAGAERARRAAAHAPSAAAHLPDAHQLARDGVARLDASRLFELGYGGGLIVDQDTRAALDLVLAEHASATGMERLEAALRSSMPKEEAERALRLVGSYRAYRAALQRELQGTPAPQDLQQMRALIDRASALRTQHFDAQTGDALFGLQETHARHALARAEIESDTTLDAATRARRLRELDGSLPQALRQELGLDQGQAARVAEEAEAMRQRGAEPSQIQAYRQRELGREQAEALSHMEAQQAQWHQRYEAYARQRRDIEAGAAGPAQRRAQLDALLRQHYAEAEIEAARAYERAQPR
jgi:lipase chaperone LimK